MSLLSKIKNKYKLLMVIFLPAIILLGFLGKFLMDEYNTVGEMQRTKELTSISDDIAIFISALEQESIQSEVYLIKKDQNSNKALLEARQKTDSAFNSLKNEVGQQSYLAKDSVNLYQFAKTFDKIESLNQKRDQIDTFSISIPDVRKIFYNYELEILSKITIIARNALNLKISRTIYSVLNLLYLNFTYAQQRELLYQAFSENQLSETNYDTLQRLLGAEEAYKTLYHEIAEDSQDDLFANTVKGQAVSESTRMIENALSSKSDSKLNIDPNSWLEMISAKMSLVSNVQHELLQQIENEAQQIIAQKKLSLYTITAIIAITLFVTLILLLLNLRSLGKQLQEEIDVLATSGQEIYSSISETSSATAETATAVTETTTTVEELKQTAQISAEKAKDVVTSAEDALKTLQTSEKSLKATIDDMHHIHDRMTTISESIVKLSEHSQVIGEIIDTVNDLAEQSNLLAVNAAIEAAKAGDQGKGFGVVAQEVRSLAEQSKQATIQVHNILKDIQNATSSAVMATEQGTKAVIKGVDQSSQTTDAIRSMTNGIAKVSQTATQIAVSSQQQLVGVDQVTIAMTNIKEASNQHVEHLQQIEAGIKGLNAVGLSLKKIVHEYKM